jgi:type VI secretion system protein ImpA
MALLDSESLLRPISVPEPAGPNLEYDAGFAEFERSLAGKAEQQIGDVLIPAEEPDWNSVQRLSLDLLARTKDLRVVCPLVRALLSRAGFVGYEEGLGLVSSMIERYWDALHPQLDPDDDNDPTIRINTLTSLCGPEAIQSLRMAPLFRSRALGPVTARDCLGGEGARLDSAAVDAASQEAALDELETLLAACDRIVEHIRAIERAFEEHVGTRGPDLSKLMQLVQQMLKFLRPRVTSRRAETGNASASHENGATNGAPSLDAPGGQLHGDVRSRDDVIRALDKICDYYQRYEPSSPIPLLIVRCKRLVSMNFLDILRDLAPEGLSQAEAVTGTKRES